MKRQLEAESYQVRDWIVNNINLAEYFTTNGHFAQAEHCLQAAFTVLPIDLGKKKKLRATLQMQMGRYYKNRLIFHVDNFLQSKELINDVVHKKFVEYDTLKLKWPQIKDIENIEEAKMIFRLSNTQLLKALEVYVLDGYVTENIEINKDISCIYRYLSSMEDDSGRFEAMQCRRHKVLAEIEQELNPKAYEGYCTELQVEL